MICWRPREASASLATFTCPDHAWLCWLELCIVRAQARSMQGAQMQKSMPHAFGPILNFAGEGQNTNPRLGQPATPRRCAAQLRFTRSRLNRGSVLRLQPTSRVKLSCVLDPVCMARTRRQSCSSTPSTARGNLGRSDRFTWANGFTNYIMLAIDVQHLQPIKACRLHVRSDPDTM